ncbi:hypothetical protein K438DRAFT_1980140 [Mycena galopus ATCC 62051]|nr:hypothetical protein K438DRAFT_1980140 [Mycena galopus ATCC 62051]
MIVRREYILLHLRTWPLPTTTALSLVSPSILFIYISGLPLDETAGTQANAGAIEYTCGSTPGLPVAATSAIPEAEELLFCPAAPLQSLHQRHRFHQNIEWKSWNHLFAVQWTTSLRRPSLRQYLRSEAGTWVQRWVPKGVWSPGDDTGSSSPPSSSPSPLPLYFLRSSLFGQKTV